MILTPSIALKQATAAAWLAALDSASGQATIELYTGGKPAGPDTALSGQTLIGVGTCSTTTGVIGTVGSVVTLTFNAIAQDNSADNAGTVTWARIKNDSGAPVIDGDVTNIGGGGMFQMNNTTVAAGGPISFASVVITF